MTQGLPALKFINVLDVHPIQFVFYMFTLDFTSLYISKNLFLNLDIMCMNFIYTLITWTLIECK